MQTEEYASLTLINDDDLVDNNSTETSYTKEDIEFIYNHIFRSIVTDSFINNIKKSNSIRRIHSTELKLLIDKIFTTRYPFFKTSKKDQQELHIIHVLLVLFKVFYYKEHLKIHIPYSDYVSFFIKPNIYMTLSKYFKNASSYVNSIVKSQYKKFKTHAEDSIRTYIVIFQSDANIIRHDISYLFIFEILSNIDPLLITEFDEYTSYQVQHLMYQYLKHKLDGLVDHNLLFTTNNTNMISETTERGNIYKTGFDIYNIQNICKSSETMKCIANNLNLIKGQIIDNQFQKLFLKYSGLELPSDTQTTILMVHDTLLNMRELKKIYPLIYHFLQCVQVKTDTINVSTKVYDQLKQAITDVLFTKFNALLTNELLTSLVTSMAQKLADAIAYSKFIDPVDMKILFISSGFVMQLKPFLNQIITTNIIPDD